MAMVRRLLLITLYSLLLLITACSQPSNNNDDQIAAANGGISGTGDGSSSYAYTTGSSYKGPMVAGSNITVYRLTNNGDLNQILSSQIINDQNQGEFAIKLPNAGIYSIQTTGKFYDEITGTYSEEVITLKVLVNMHEASPKFLLPDGIHANVLTTLIHDDMLNLINNGKTYEDAYNTTAAKVSKLFEAMTGAFNLSKPFMYIGIEPTPPTLALPDTNIEETSIEPPTTSGMPITPPETTGDSTSIIPSSESTNSELPPSEEEDADTETSTQANKDDSAFLIYLSALVTKTAQQQNGVDKVAALLSQIHTAYTQPIPVLPENLLAEFQQAQQNLDETQVKTNLEGQFGNTLPDIETTVAAIDSNMQSPTNFSSTQITRTLGSLELRCFNYDGSSASTDGCDGNNAAAVGYVYEIQASLDNSFPDIAGTTKSYISTFNWSEFDIAEFSSGTWYIRVRKVWDNGQKGLWAEANFTVP